jgi:hypothetical protein
MKALNMSEHAIKPFDNCPALDGYHCQTNSLAKIYHFNEAPLSEEMLFGLGGGIGYIYWHPKDGSPFIGGRGNTKGFFADVGKKTGVTIAEVTTSSPKKAQALLLSKLKESKPVMVFGDMGYLPWFRFPEDYHFGGHTFVVCGYDGNESALASDLDHKTTGLKKGFYHPISLTDLAKARGSVCKPFPPKNVWLDFDFTGYEPPIREDILGSVRRNAGAMLYPSISNLGVRGIRRTSRELLKWPAMFDEARLDSHLFGIYISVEIGGTGGGCFRQMYSRFLLEAAAVTSNRTLKKASAAFSESGNLFTEAALLFASAHEESVPRESITRASELFAKIADVEEKAFDLLYEKLPDEA